MVTSHHRYVLPLLIPKRKIKITLFHRSRGIYLRVIPVINMNKKKNRSNGTKIIKSLQITFRTATRRTFLSNSKVESALCKAVNISTKR